MAKYDPLFDHLRSLGVSHWRASMTEIEKVLGSPLPPSARRSSSWWANVRNSTHVQATAWMDAGWETSDVTPGGRVTFRRVNSGAVIARVPSGLPPKPMTAKPAVPTAPTPAHQPTQHDPAEREELPNSGTPSDWFWEGNVVASIARHLSETGWHVVKQANTATKERGVDLHAERRGQTLLVEAKGYPSKVYRDPMRATEAKPTNPTNQAQHWYSHALLKVMRLQTEHPEARIAMAFPDFPRYRTLFAETEAGLRRLGIAVLFVFENQRVEAIGL